MGVTLRKICNGKEIWVGKHSIVKFISTHRNSERSIGRMVTLKLTFTQPDCGWHQHKFKVDTNENQADKWSRWALFIFSTSFVGFGMYSIKMIWLRNLQILSNKTVAKKVNLWPFFFFVAKLQCFCIKKKGKNREGSLPYKRWLGPMADYPMKNNKTQGFEVQTWQLHELPCCNLF